MWKRGDACVIVLPPCKPYTLEVIDQLSAREYTVEKRAIDVKVTEEHMRWLVSAFPMGPCHITLYGHYDFKTEEMERQKQMLVLDNRRKNLAHTLLLNATIRVVLVRNVPDFESWMVLQNHIQGPHHPASLTSVFYDPEKPIPGFWLPVFNERDEIMTAFLGPPVCDE